MNGLAFILALAVGQVCPGGSCAAPSRAQFIQRGRYHDSWQTYCVRVDIQANGHGYGGSGTIIGVEGNEALVITARHVAEHQGAVTITHRGTVYPAKLLALARTGDLAAITFANPPDEVKGLRVADKPGRESVMFGYGPGDPGQLHVHGGRFLGRNVNVQQYNEQGLPDDRYAMNCEDGDSGGGVFDEQGDLSGVIYAGGNGESWVVSTAKLRQFLSAPATTERTFTLTPFFIKCKRIRREPAQTVQGPAPSVPQPGTTNQPSPKPEPATPGIAGKDGLNGKDGAAGKDADPTILNQLIAATQANTKAIADLTGQVQQIKNQPPTPAIQPPLLRMNATNAAGAIVSTKDYVATTDLATGKLIYNVTMSPLTTLTTTP